MKLLASQNMRSAALAQFEQCRRVLADELGVEPDSDTLSVFEQIRQGKSSNLSSKVRSEKPLNWQPWQVETHSHWLPSKSALIKPSAPRFVGRQQQIARLRSALDLALEGHGQVVFIKGEAGSGKTSLSWEFAYRAMYLHSNLLTAARRCNAITRLEDPYLPFRELVQMLAGIKESQDAHFHAPEYLRRLNSAFPDTVRSLLSAAPELLGAFIPADQLAQRIRTHGPSQQSLLRDFQQANTQPAAGAGYSPLETVTRLLTELARRRPLVLLLDDLQ